MIYKCGYDEYRDDRQFVMNLSRMSSGQWNLTTYRNTGALPAVRDDDFATFEDAERYVKKFEPLCPLVSLHGAPLTMTETGIEQKFEAYKQWLHSQGLFSTLDLKTHVPLFVSEEGYVDVTMSTHKR